MIQEQVLVVTGARTGLGRHLAEHYLSLGWTVVGCSRQPFDLQSEHYRHYICDVSQAAEVSQMFLAIRREFGRVDALINNAVSYTDYVRRVVWSQSKTVVGWLLLTEYYSRVVGRTSSLTEDLVENLTVAGHDVTVVCSGQRYRGRVTCSVEQVSPSVQVIRCPTTGLSRRASRRNYWRRVAQAYLGPGHSQLTFWHERPTACLAGLMG